MIREILEQHLNPSAEYVFGTTDLTGLTDKKFGEFQYGISIGKRLNNQIIDAIENGPTIDFINKMPVKQLLPFFV